MNPLDHLFRDQPKVTLKYDGPLKVIGAGLSRTGTGSLYTVLCLLGFLPTEHGHTLLADSSRCAKTVEFYNGTRSDWREHYAGFQAAVDAPVYDFVPELMAAFPEAKVVLTIRDSPEAWSKSYTDVVAPVRSTWYLLSVFWLRPIFWASRLTRSLEAKQKRLYGTQDAASAENYVKHVEYIKAVVPADKLLVFNVKEGWLPLCKFLDVPVPNKVFPMTNDSTLMMTQLAYAKRLGQRIWLGIGTSVACLICGYTCLPTQYKAFSFINLFVLSRR